MNIAVWIMQLVIAGMFVMAGGNKAFSSRQKLEEKMPALAGGSLLPVRLLGYVELLGVAGLILPASLHVLPVLTAWAAVGAGVVMVGAIVLHAMRKEYKVLPLVSALLVMSVIVAAYRF